MPDDDRRRRRPKKASSNNSKDDRPARSLLLAASLTAGLVLLLLLAAIPMGQESLTHSQLNELVAKGEVAQVIFRGDEAHVTLRPGALKSDASASRERTVKFSTLEQAARYQDSLEGLAKDKASSVEIMSRPASNLLAQLALWTLPTIIVIGATLLIIRQMRAPGAPGSVLNFGKSRHRMASRDKSGVTLDDVAGCDEAKEEIKEIIEFLRDPKKFSRLGGRIPKGVLLVGAPGTGKTLLAKAAAGEADVPFFSVCGSDFVEMFVGVGASRVRDLFDKAKENSPCILFLDEVDAVGRRRGSGLGGGHDEREQTLNQILVEMDGFDTDKGIIVVAATNRPDILDPALLRPGRFDRQIVLDMPDVKGREEILKVHAKNVKLAANVDLRALARATPTFSGAELEAVINEAALGAALANRDAIAQADLEEARDKVRWGRSKKSRVMTEADRRATAYHEAGHALVAAKLEGCDPLHKVTIVPRGVALGVTMALPDQDRYGLTKKQCLAQIAMCFGGRLGEQMATADLSTGASNDIEKATDLARRMVCEWGMSEEMGPINFSEEQDTVFLGREITRTKNHSEETAKKIDAEVRKIIESSLKRAEQTIQQHRKALDSIAEGLLRHETLSGEEVASLIDGRATAATLRVEAPRAPEPRPLSDVVADEPRPEPRPLTGSGPATAGAMA